MKQMPREKCTQIRAFLFDLDGTLADTLDDIAFSVNHVLQQHNFPVHPTSEYRMMVGDGFTCLMERALPREACLTSSEFNMIKEEAAACYSSNVMRSTRAFPEIPEVLEQLSCKEIPCAVLTNKPDNLAQLLIAKLFLSFKFFVIAGDLPGKLRKPDPSRALEIAELSGIPASSWAMVGDSGVDMEMATRAGMLPCGCLWGYRSEDELRNAGAAYLLEKPSDLLGLV